MKNLLNTRFYNEEMELYETLQQDLLIDKDIEEYKQYVKDSILNKIIYQWNHRLLYQDWVEYEIDETVQRYIWQWRDKILKIIMNRDFNF